MEKGILQLSRNKINSKKSIWILSLKIHLDSFLQNPIRVLPFKTHSSSITIARCTWRSLNQKLEWDTISIPNFFNVTKIRSHTSTSQLTCTLQKPRKQALLKSVCSLFPLTAVFRRTFSLWTGFSPFTSRGKRKICFINTYL